jgi:hypothetical protein
MVHAPKSELAPVVRKRKRESSTFLVSGSMNHRLRANKFDSVAVAKISRLAKLFTSGEAGSLSTSTRRSGAAATAGPKRTEMQLNGSDRPDGQSCANKER